MVVLRIAVLSVSIALLPNPTLAQVSTDDIINFGTELLRTYNNEQGDQPPPQQPQASPPATPQPPQEPAAATPPAPPSSQADVAEAQALLNSLGYDAGPVDGVMGAKTRRAIAAFQQSNGLAPTGLADAHTLAIMRASTPPAEQPSVAEATPSFECTRATTPTEFAICGTPSLAVLDRRVAEAFAHKSDSTASGERSNLRAEQKAWLTQRNACGADVTCLGRTMEARLADLGEPNRETSDTATMTGLTNPATPTIDETANVTTGSPVAPPSGPANFENTPEPDYVTLLRLYMASNADLLDNDAFAFEHFKVFDLPSRPDRKAAERECMDLRDTMENEISRRSLVAKVRARLAQDLKAVGTWPKTATFLLKTSRNLEEYDFENQKFPLGFEVASGSIPFASPVEIADSEFYQKRGAYPGPVTWICTPGLMMRDPLQGVVPGRFAIEVTSPDVLTELPMQTADAEAYLKKGRRVAFEYLVDVGPIVHGWKGTSGQSRFGTTAPATIIAARALDPDGKVLHVYDPAMFRGSASPAAAPAAGEDVGEISGSAVPLTPHILALLTVKQHPELLTSKNLERLTHDQVFAEQQLWKGIGDYMKNTGGKGDANRPLLVYEWQTLTDKDPATARLLLQNLFAAERPDWRFAEEAGTLDPRLNYEAKQAFVFARAGVVGRDSWLAAGQLAPVMKRHMLETAALVHHPSYFFTLPLPGFDYDFAQSAIVFGKNDYLRQPDVVFASSFDPEKHGSLGYVLPDALKVRAVYSFNDGMTPRSERVQGIAASNSAHTHWREMFSGMTSMRPELLALDRYLTFNQVPVEPTDAEKWYQYRYSGGLTARISVSISGVELARRKSDKDGEPVPVLVATITAIQFVTNDGNVLVSLDPGAIPGAAETIAAADAASAAQAAAAAKQVEADTRAQQAAADKLAALVGDRTGLLMVRRAGAPAAIETVYTGGSTDAITYKHIVRGSSLDLPPLSKAAPKGMAKVLREEPGAAVVINVADFKRDLFPKVQDLDLTVTAFPPDLEAALNQNSSNLVPVPLPEDARYLLLRRRDDQAPLARVVTQDDGSVFYQSAMFEAAFGQHYLDELGVTIAYEMPQEAEGAVLRDIPGMLREQSGVAFVLRREGVQSIWPKISDLDLVVRRFPPEEFQIGIPKDHTEGADKFAILGISGGFDEAAAMAAVKKEFTPGEIVSAEGGSIRALRGACDVTDPLASGKEGEIGAFCLDVRSTDGKTSHVALRQVIPGGGEAAALEALRQKFGRSPFTMEVRHLDRGGRRTVYGWGAPLAVDRVSLGRVDAKTPPTVLEAVVWVEDGVATVLIQLDDVPSLDEVKAGQTPKIKF